MSSARNGEQRMDNPHARCRVYYIPKYIHMYVALRCLATNSVSASASVCLTLDLGTAITFALRLWHGCSGIALRA